MKKRGISLLVLVITIVIIIIISSVVILSVNNTDLFGNATEAVFKNDVSSYKYELENYLQNRFTNDIFANKENINASGEEILEYVKSVKNEDINKLKIFEGELIFIGKDEDEIEWAKEIGITVIDVDSINIESLEQIGSTYNSVTLKTVMEDKYKNYKFNYTLLDSSGNVISTGKIKETGITNINNFEFSNLKINVNESYSVEVEVSYYGITAKKCLEKIELDRIAPGFAYSDGWTKELEITVIVPTIINDCDLVITLPGYIDEVIVPMESLETLEHLGEEVFGTKVTAFENGTVTAVVKDKDGNIYSEGSAEIKTIDNVAPTAPTKVTVTTTVTTATAVAEGSDDGEGSGFAKYQYSLDNINWQDSSTFSGIKSGTNVVIYARAVDKLGNISNSKASSATSTSTIGKVSLNQSITSWTNQNVTLTISHSKAGTDGYLLMYSVDGGQWVTLTSGASSTNITIYNNSSVSAKIYNSVLDDEGNSLNTRNITNIDKVAPTKPTQLSGVSDTTTITATASGSTDNSQSYGGTVTYYYSIDNSTWNTTGKFTSLTSGTTYTVYAKAKDLAGNYSEVVTSTINTKLQLNVSFSGSFTSHTKNTTSCSVTASGTIGYYNSSRSGTMTITGVPAGATINYSCSNTSYASASLTFAGTKLSGTNSSYVTTTSGTISAQVTSSKSGYSGTVTIHSIVYNGEYVEFK